MSPVQLLAFALAALAGPPNVVSLDPPGARRGTTVEVTVRGKLDSWPVEVLVEGAGIEGGGVEASAAAEKGKLSIKVLDDAAPGVRWIRIHDASGSASPRPFVVGTILEAMEKEPNDSREEAGEVVQMPLTLNGRLARTGDVDSFALQLEAGQTLVGALDAHGNLGAPLDGVLQVTSSDGFVLASNNDDRGLDPLVVFTARTSGIHVVRVFGFPAEPGSAIALAGGDAYVYRLTLTTGGFADHAYPLLVSRSRPGIVGIVGWNVPESARILAVDVRSAGTSSDFVTLHHPLLANTVLVHLEPSEVEVQVEVEPNGRERPQELSLPAAITGRMDALGDADVFRLPARKGAPLRVSLFTPGRGYPFEPILEVSSSGKIHEGARGGALQRRPEVSFTPTEDGECLVEVRDLHLGGGMRHVYALRAAAIEPDFELSVADTTFSLQPGTPLEVAVKVRRMDGFEEEIEIAASGLPGTVETPPATSPPTGDAAKLVKLKLSAEAGAPSFSGPFRISGASRGTRSLSRAARAPLPGEGASTEQLWLTVLGAPLTN
ncbi:MAG TPA: pre-peptidase [Planctomycetota bacterium]|nr:pre-peptidase [Planctomycetota bacterium]